MTLFDDEFAQPPPRFPEPQFSSAHVCHEAGVGYLLASSVSGRRFFCAEDSPCVPTQFSGSVSKCYEVESLAGDCDSNPETARHPAPRLESDEDEEDTCIVSVEGELLRYCPSRPMALKTCRIAVLRLEAQCQNRQLGELNGEDPVKEIATLQLLQEDESGHGNVEELEEAMVDDTTLYKVTPWYDGGELFDLAPMPEDSAKTVFAQLLDALAYLQARGVCHRDISLENILMDTRVPGRRSAALRSSSVSSIGSCISVASSTASFGDEEDERDCDELGDSVDQKQRVGTEADGVGQARGWIGRPRLCDFGMSVRIPKSSATGKNTLLTPQGRCGKDTCVAPEVFYDQEFDAQAVDSWSLGTTLFMALLGVQPWEEVGDYKFQAIAEGKNLDVVLEGWKLRDVISQDAVDLLQAMLTTDPEERLFDVKSILAHPWFHS